MIATATASRNGTGAPRQSEPATIPPKSAELFDANAIKRLRLMRVNPMPLLQPASLGMWLDQFDAGHLNIAATLWDQMCRRDDTLVLVKPQLENEVASQDWGTFPIEGADEKEAARHKAAITYCLEHCKARDAFDKNVRGGRHKLLKQMMQADSCFYAVHHLAWIPQPGKMIQVEGAEPVPALTLMLENVPLWFFENTTGQLRLLKDGLYGADGEELDWESGEWMVTTGRGLMFAASICVTFKRLSFQDWTIFNERYAQNKVVGVTPATADSPQGQSMAALLAAFNSDNELLITEFQGDPDKLPIQLLGPTGTASVEVWEKFLERQDRKMTAMYRGGDLSTQSRGGQGEQPVGASLQSAEGRAMLRGASQSVADAMHEFIVRPLIRFCFGDGVEPMAYFGLPDLEPQDVKELRESAGFLADRGARVRLSDVAERVNVQLVPEGEDDHDVLEAAIKPGADETEKGKPAAAGKTSTSNASDPDLEGFLAPYVGQFREAFAGDMQALRSALEHAVKSPNAAVQLQNVQVLRAQLPDLAQEILAAPRTAPVLADLMKEAMRRGYEQAGQERRAA